MTDTDTTPRTALAHLASVLEQAESPLQARRACVEVALRSAGARTAFLARREPDGLQLVVGCQADGAAATVSGTTLGQVQRALEGAFDEETGEGTRGGVRVEEAGVWAVPVRGVGAQTWEGALGVEVDAVDDDTAGLLGVVAALVAGASAEPKAKPVVGAAEGFKYRYDAMITQAPAMLRIFKKLDRIIGADVPVLITGETGTGKELIARAIHRNDPERGRKRFYAQNCGALQANLLESELFGYEKGAFTGADRRKKGLFEVASGSTLFLDEVGEMSLDMQTKLLRVLQEGEIVPLGSTEPVAVSVRIVAATLRDLDEAVSSGRFRADLYFRLKVVRLRLPPLRERLEDLPLLIEHLLDKIARRQGTRPKVLDRRDPRVMEALTAYDWPGNVRELENTLTRLSYLSSGDVITYEALSEEGQLLGELEPQRSRRPVRALKDLVAEVERQEIEHALAEADGNRTKAAELLQIDRHALRRRLKAYGLDED